MEIINELKKLKLKHYCCTDSYYSCPKSKEGCSNDFLQNKEKCDCGAEEHNKNLNKIINYFKNSEFFTKQKILHELKKLEHIDDAIAFFETKE